ncbi:hypothetical protein J6590_033212 [Homalodisca vitripennis]|nr:hypothetical protein J6590_033212 [Homalodisca vitripennis]
MVKETVPRLYPYELAISSLRRDATCGLRTLSSGVAGTRSRSVPSPTERARRARLRSYTTTLSVGGPGNFLRAASDEHSVGCSDRQTQLNPVNTCARVPIDAGCFIAPLVVLRKNEEVRRGNAMRVKAVLEVEVQVVKQMWSQAPATGAGVGPAVNRGAGPQGHPQPLSCD